MDDDHNIVIVFPCRSLTYNISENQWTANSDIEIDADCLKCVKDQRNVLCFGKKTEQEADQTVTTYSLSEYNVGKSATPIDITIKDCIHALYFNVCFY